MPFHMLELHHEGQRGRSRTSGFKLWVRPSPAPLTTECAPCLAGCPAWLHRPPQAAKFSPAVICSSPRGLTQDHPAFISRVFVTCCTCCWISCCTRLTSESLACQDKHHRSAGQHAVKSSTASWLAGVAWSCCSCWSFWWSSLMSSASACSFPSQPASSQHAPATATPSLLLQLQLQALHLFLDSRHLHQVHCDSRA